MSAPGGRETSRNPFVYLYRVIAAVLPKEPNVRMIMFYELEVLVYHKTFFQSLTEKNSKEFVGMISHRIQFSCCEKQSVQLE
jgi:hypothetical protein